VPGTKVYKTTTLVPGTKVVVFNFLDLPKAVLVLYNLRD